MILKITIGSSYGAFAEKQSVDIVDRGVLNWIYHKEPSLDLLNKSFTILKHQKYTRNLASRV